MGTHRSGARVQPTVMALAMLVCAVTAVAACGNESKTETLTFSGVWSRPTPGDATNGVIYLSVTSPVDDEILSVSVPASIAGAAMMHDTLLDGIAPPAAPGTTLGGSPGQMSMAPLESLPLPAGQTVVFEAGGKHIMLTDLVAPLVAGQTFALTFELREAGTQTVDVLVTPNPPG